MIQKICVIGLGYVGLPTALLFAEKGYAVIGADIDQRKIDSLKRGESYLGELGLDERIASAVKSGNLQATSDIAGAVSECDAIIITVPTPLKENNEPDLSFIESSGEMIILISL